MSLGSACTSKARVGNVSMLTILFRTYASASDVSARAFFTELKTPSISNFARFLSVSNQNMLMDKNARTIFGTIKDLYFESLGMTADQYLGIENMVEQINPIYYGHFHNLFYRMKDLEADNSSRYIYLYILFYFNIYIYILHVFLQVIYCSIRAK